MAEPQLTQSERARLYCVMIACSYGNCGAQRGQFCRHRDGRQWLKSWHGNRGRDVQRERRANPDFRERYKHMIAQIRAERMRDCGDHEMREG